uniref:TRUD domain-containing protein n=1 Tax=Globisporangium ultimum (strain ATCC 200006 / CBS 805.95 / DAOM BR144) TaxID=431595 RepID=K3WGV5_GLOUD
MADDKNGAAAAEELLLNGSVVGIEEFLHADRPVVTGKLKEKPEDFVVQEISAKNEVVAFGDDATANRVPTAEERDAMVQALLDAKSNKAPKKEKLVFEKPAEGWRHALEQQIGAQKAQEVAAIADEKQDDCLIDAPVEFRDRVFLQVCIQNCFPGLDCKLRKHDDDPEQEKTQIHVLPDPMYKKFRSGGMSVENGNRLLEYLRKGASDELAPTGVELVHDDTKEARTLLHRLISKHSSCFKTKTVTDAANVQKLVVFFSEKASKKRKRNQPEVYLQFVLQKTNLEHFACFERLSRELKRPLSAFSYAGIKDKAAITYQHVVAQGVQPRDLLTTNNLRDFGKESSGFRVGNLEFVGAPMGLGDASGNRFTISLQDVACESDAQSAISVGVVNVQRQGFINYFGFQRVGLPTNEVRPHHIGQQILAGNWERAVKLIFIPSVKEPEAIAKAKRVYLETANVDAALGQMPSRMNLERSILQGFKRYGHDAFDRAIGNVSFSRRLMYMHAYQSYLFNRMASARLRLYGNKLVAGDLVRETPDDEDSKAGAVVAISSEQAAKLNEEHEHPLKLLVLPLAGSNVIYPANDIGKKYLELMEEHGTKAYLSEPGPVKGSYRPVVAYLRDLEWSLESGEEKGPSVLRISFALPSGSFATMCLREILKFDL